MAKLEYTFKTDILFKTLFVKRPDLLKQLVCELIGICLDSIGEFQITNPEMPPEVLGDKFCRLDINMTVDGQRVDLEIQVRNEGDYPERILYNWARDYSTALTEGGKYLDLPRTVIISILNFKLFDCMEFHSEYQALEVTRHDPLTDKMSLHFFELPKIPAGLSVNNKLLLWLSLFKAETLEELEKIKALEVPVMDQAINAYQKIAVSPELREIERARSYARHNEASALYHAREEGEKKGMEQGIVKGMEQGIVKGIEQEREDLARNALEEGIPIELIKKITGLGEEALKHIKARLKE
jgi:predicted transposase/invertase (TIGR01784 family)